MIKIGYWKLDKMLGGFDKGKIYVLAGRNGMGKTDFALTLAKYVAISNKKDVWYIISKHNEQEAILENKLVDSIAKIKGGDRINGLSLECWRNGYRAMQEIKNSPLFFVHKKCIDICDVVCMLRNRKNPPKLIIFDDLMILASNFHMVAGMIEKLTCTLNEIQELAKKLNVPILIITDIKKSVDKRDNPFPNIEDIKYSKQIRCFADAIITMYREEYYDIHTDKLGVCEFKIFIEDDVMYPMKLAYASLYSTFYNLVEG